MNVHDVIASLKETGTEAVRTDMLRYGIPNDNAVGIRMADMKRFAKSLGTDHTLASELWRTGIYEARTIAALIADPQRMTTAEADHWCAGFDSWAICDTTCFHLLDRTPFAWEKVHAWAPDPREFVRRAAFALIWALSTHDKSAENAAFLGTFKLMRAAATDPRPLVKKAVDMSLRATGKRNAQLNIEASAFAEELSGCDDKTAKWIGRHAHRELSSQKVRSRLGL